MKTLQETAQAAAKSIANQMQEAACVQFTRLLSEQHPEWQAKIEYRFGQVVIESAPEHGAAVRAWLENPTLSLRPQRYATGNQSHLRGASDWRRLPKSVLDEKTAEDIGEEPRAINAEYRGPAPEKMDRV